MRIADAVRTDSRMAGNIVRYHTWPVLVQQTNAHHTWNVLRIMLEIWGHAPAEVLAYLVFHDAGELGAADVAFPYKAQNPVLKAEITRLEHASLVAQGAGAYREMEVEDSHTDTEMWRCRAKTCDLLEMLEKGLEEYLMGNRFGWGVVENILENLAARKYHEEDDAHSVRCWLKRRLEKFQAVVKNGDGRWSGAL